MRSLLKAAALALLLLAAPAAAQERTATSFVTPLGYCQLTSIASSTLVSSCSSGIPQRTAWAVICVETNNIRWRDDGVAPSTTVGMPVVAGQCIYYSGTFATLRVIAQSGSPVVNINFYTGAPRL